MFVSKSICNIEVVVQPETVQGFTKHETLHYTGDNRGTGGESEEEAEKKYRREHNKRDEEEKG